MEQLVKQTMIISLIAQAITTIVGIWGFYIKLDKKHLILKDVLVLDTVVQIIESSMYLWIFFAVTNYSIMVRRRYIDWFITTPIMLVSTIIYMKYNTYIDKGNENTLTLKEFFKEEAKSISIIVILNVLMLLFGYLGETRIINKSLSIIIGFVLFFINFKLIYKYVDGNKKNKKMFYFVFIVWSLYGVAALFNDVYKNISYNMLDIVSKNFYGIYIFYIILKLAKPNEQLNLNN